MPRGPRGERRPADVVSCAVTVARIATGEDEETKLYKHPGKRKGGTAGGRSRANVLTKERRQAIARKGAEARWGAPMESEEAE